MAPYIENYYEPVHHVATVRVVDDAEAVARACESIGLVREEGGTPDCITVGNGSQWIILFERSALAPYLLPELIDQIQARGALYVYVDGQRGANRAFGVTVARYEPSPGLLECLLMGPLGFVFVGSRQAMGFLDAA